MKLKVISPTETRLFEVVWIDINTPVGSFVIQKGHVPTILTLSPDQMVSFGLKNGKQEAIAVRRGFIDVSRDVATLLVSD